MEGGSELPVPLPVSETRLAAAVAWLEQQPAGAFYLRWMVEAERGGQLYEWLVMVGQLRRWSAFMDECESRVPRPR